MTYLKHLFLLIILVNISIISLGSCFPPKIQAVCEITKKDGTVIQGYITLGTNDCNGMWMNGFLFYSDSIYLNPTYFTMDVKSIEFKDSFMIYQFGGSAYGIAKTKYLKYMVWNSDPLIHDSYLHKLTIENGKLMFNITANHERKYVLLDSIRIYHELDEYTFVPTNENDLNYTSIAMSDILKISLLEKENISNLSEIIMLGTAAEKRAYSPPASMEDFQLPLWYHNIINDPILLKQVNKAIDDFTILN